METFINNIFDILVKILPSDWRKIVLHVSLGSGEQTIYFFVQGTDRNQYYSYYDLQKMGIFSRAEYRDVRIAIGKESHNFRESFKEKWTGYTLKITRDGKINMDYEFEEQSLDIPDGWKEKYLN